MEVTKLTHPKLRIPQDAMYQLQREGCIAELNTKKAAGEKADQGGYDLSKLDFGDSYIRQSSLRGVDLGMPGSKGQASTPQRFQELASRLGSLPWKLSGALLQSTRLRYRV